jgi:hypothetical protein
MNSDKSLTSPIGTFRFLPCAMVTLSVVQASPVSAPGAAVFRVNPLPPVDGVYWILQRPNSWRKQILEEMGSEYKLVSNLFMHNLRVLTCNIGSVA